MSRSSRSINDRGQAERALWLDLCGADGMRYALPYRELRAVEMPSPQSITLRFLDRRVIIDGRNLAPAYEDLIRERVERLQEDDVDWASESETFISNLTIVRSQENE